MFAAVLALALCAPPSNPKYIADYEYVVDVVAREGASVKSKKIDWKSASSALKPKFEKCADDAAHVANVMELLAILRDNHTGVTDTAVGWDNVPQFAKGHFGGGLDIASDHGFFVVAGVVDGHPSFPAFDGGVAIAQIGGEPAWFAMERARRRISRYHGISTEHWFYASLRNRFFPFGEAQLLKIAVVDDQGKPSELDLPRFGPRGQGFDLGLSTLPDGLDWKKGAVSTFLSKSKLDKLGYLRITGAQDQDTVTAFDAAFDTLRGMSALLLDGRGMGGGGDSFAWTMTGRLFTKPANNGLHGEIAPSGSWQFDGPAVFLQDERMVSSAETFAWAVSETKRTISVGRHTGGWGIIPKGYELPSGLAKFRLGVNDRPTPIEKKHTEGIGWPANIEIPIGPRLCWERDFVREVGENVIAVLASGAARDDVIELFSGLFQGKIAAFEKTATKYSKVPGFDARRMATVVKRDLDQRLSLELALLDPDVSLAPDVLGATERLVALEPRAIAAGFAAKVASLKKKLAGMKADADAQREFLSKADDDLVLPDTARMAFKSKHKASALAKFLNR